MWFFMDNINLNLFAGKIPSTVDKWRYRFPPTGCTNNYVLYVMLNPAEGTPGQPDRTMIKLGAITHANYCQPGQFCSCFVIRNLFAYLTPYPRVLKKRMREKGPDFVIGLPQNDVQRWLSDAKDASKIVLGWGNHAGDNSNTRQRSSEVLQWLQAHYGHTLYYLRRTNQGYPSHPLDLEIPNNVNFQDFHNF